MQGPGSRDEGRCDTNESLDTDVQEADQILMQVTDGEEGLVAVTRKLRMLQSRSCYLYPEILP